MADLALAALYFRFLLPRRDSRFCHPRSVKLRSPQIPYLFLLLALFQKLTGYPVSFPAAAFYYSLRFGSGRIVTGSLLLVFLGMAWGLGFDSPPRLGLGVLMAGGLALMVDLTWNWNLKRLGIEVPGQDPE